MGKQVEVPLTEIESNVVEWKDSVGWTKEILQAIIDVITLWEMKHGLNSGDPRNVTEFLPRSSQPTEK